ASQRDSSGVTRSLAVPARYMRGSVCAAARAATRWVRFVTGAGVKPVEIADFERETRFCGGFDWVRFVGEDPGTECRTLGGAGRIGCRWRRVIAQRLLQIPAALQKCDHASATRLGE